MDLSPAGSPVPADDQNTTADSAAAANKENQSNVSITISIAPDFFSINRTYKLKR